MFSYHDIKHVLAFFHCYPFKQPVLIIKEGSGDCHILCWGSIKWYIERSFHVSAHRPWRGNLGKTKKYHNDRRISRLSDSRFRFFKPAKTRKAWQWWTCFTVQPSHHRGNQAKTNLKIESKLCTKADVANSVWSLAHTLWTSTQDHLWLLETNLLQIHK